jgi:hypothetical protein
MSKRTIYNFVAVACVAMFLSACGSKSKKSCTVSGDCDAAKMCQEQVCVDRPTCTGTCEGTATCMSGICMDCLTNDECTVPKMICNTSYVCVYEKCDTNPCGTHMTVCDDTTGQFVCTCDTANGYTGDRCDQCAVGYEPGDNSTCVPSIHCDPNDTGNPCDDSNPCSQDACDPGTSLCVHTPLATPSGTNCDPDGDGALGSADGVCTANMTCLRLECRECALDADCVGGHCVCSGSTCPKKRCHDQALTSCQYLLYQDTYANCSVTAQADSTPCGTIVGTNDCTGTCSGGLCVATTPDCGVCCKCDSSGAPAYDATQDSECTNYSAINQCSPQCSALNKCAIPKLCGSMSGCLGECVLSKTLEGVRECSTNTNACECGTNVGTCVQGLCYANTACSVCVGGRASACISFDPLICCNSGTRTAHCCEKSIIIIR